MPRSCGFGMTEARERPPLPRTPLWDWVHARFSRVDAVLMATLTVFSFVLQWPHRPLFLNVWDSFLFANAAIEYDLLGGYPHPPGYPVFVFVVKLVALFVEPSNALELVSMGFAAASVGLLFGFLREFVARPAAALAAFVFAFCPTLFYNGLMSLSYSAECAGSIGVAWLAWRAREDPSITRTVTLAGVFGVCAGLRTTIFLYLIPLATWAVWSHPASAPDRLRRFVVAGGVGLAAMLSWMLPMWMFGGDLETWLFTTRVQSEVVIFSNTVWTNGWDAVAEQGGRIIVYMEPEVSVLMAGLATTLLALFFLRHEKRGPVWKPIRFAFIWVGPSLLFMALVFSGWARGPRGYALVFLPALYFLLGAGVASAMAAHLPRLESPGRRSVAVAVAAALVLSPLPFLGPERDELIGPDIYGRNSWGTGWLGLKDAWPPNETAILTSHQWEFARWYFPEYVVWGYLPGATHPDWNLAPWHFVLEARERKDDAPLYGVYRAGVPLDKHPIPEGVTRIVLTDFAMAGEDGGTRVVFDDVTVHEAILPNQWRLLYFDVDPSRPFIEDYVVPLGVPPSEA